MSQMCSKCAMHSAACNPFFKFKIRASFRTSTAKVSHRVRLLKACRLQPGVQCRSGAAVQQVQPCLLCIRTVCRIFTCMQTQASLSARLPLLYHRLLGHPRVQACLHAVDAAVLRSNAFNRSNPCGRSGNISDSCHFNTVRLCRQDRGTPSRSRAAAKMEADVSNAAFTSDMY